MSRIKKTAAKILNIILDTIFPVSCFLCGDDKNGAVVCSSCDLEIVKNSTAVCSICRRIPSMCGCNKYANIDNLYSVFVYGDKKLVKLLFKLKNKDSRKLAVYFAEKMNELIKLNNIDLSSIDAITAVPRNTKSARINGTDQSVNLAKRLSELTNIEYKALIKRTGKSAEQKTLTAEERHANVSGIFKAETSDKRNVILIDDVVTTGSSVSECAGELKASGVEKIIVICIAKAGKMDKIAVT